MNCKSSLLPCNVIGSCKSFINLHLCFVSRQGLVTISAGPQQDVYILCNRNYQDNGNTWTGKYICLLTDNQDLRNYQQTSSPPQA